MLQSLELVGFKSFADRTRLEFSRGVTAVVGPNGSGKSNVVDAIKWVLGSQSAKSLRGGEMTDVIFSGTTKRRALNAAEVTLTIDNSTGLLDFDAPHVALTRRVLRSGESEYLINRQPCRLRDIRDLLAGTGIGTEAYSIIEQGKVDALLQASPKDRRTIFEEAAGISRFRNKRVEALRRLQRVDQNLLRLADIVDEVETRLRSVRAQAGKAQSYREQVARLQKLRISLGLADWTRLTRQLDAATKQLATIDDRQAADRKLVAQAEAHLPSLEEQLERIDSEIAQLDKERTSFRETALRSELSAAKGLQQIDDADAAIARHHRDWKVSFGKPSPQAIDKPPRVDALAAVVDEQREQLERASNDVARQERHHLLAVAQHEEVTARLAKIEQQLTETGAELAKLDGTKDDTERQLAKLRQEADSLCQRIPQEEQTVEASRVRLRQIEQRLATLDQEYAAVERHCSQHDEQLPAARRRAQESAAQVARLEQRLELAGEYQRQLHNRQQQVATVLRNLLGDDVVPTTLADVVHVDVDIASMIEAALGAAAQQFVTEMSAGELQRLSRAAAEANLRIAVIARDYRIASHAADHIDLSVEMGVLGRADQFVDAEPEYLPLLRRILGRTWLVDELSTALRLSSSTGRGMRFVTVEGEVVDADGAVELGIAASDWQVAGGENQRAQSRAELRNAIEQHEQHEQHLNQAERELATSRERLRALTQQRTAASDQLATARTQNTAAESKLHESTRQAEQVATQLDELENLLSEKDERALQFRQQQDELAPQVAQLSRACQSLAKATGDAATARESASQRHREAELALARAEQDLLAAKQLARQLDHQLPAETVDYPRVIAAQLLQRQRLELSVLRTSAERNHATWHRCRVDRESVLARQQRKAIRERGSQITQALAETRKQLDGQNRQRQELQVTATRIDYQRQTLAERLRDDYEVDIAKVAEQTQVIELDQPRLDVEREIERLRQSINRIGAVNSDALEELESIERRYEEISSQYNDLSTAKESLEKIIAQLNGDSRKLFFDTVDTVREHFRELFRRLFGGGDADIVLESATGDDPLECGIEIQACPPGKETRNISLLSGGEKTLTCVALLLAMFRSKPSPFCLLDEVDAALDESNIGRFTNVLRDFLSDTQFIVITHSKKTMTAADTLYGITMQESGVSKQVSVRFDDVDDEGNVRPRSNSATSVPQEENESRRAA